MAEQRTIPVNDDDCRFPESCPVVIKESKVQGVVQSVAVFGQPILYRVRCFDGTIVHVEEDQLCFARGCPVHVFCPPQGEYNNVTFLHEKEAMVFVRDETQIYVLPKDHTVVKFRRPEDDI